MSVKDESERMRGLIKEFHEYVREQVCRPDEECAEFGCFMYDEEHECCWFDHEMRELGIEVE